MTTNGRTHMDCDFEGVVDAGSNGQGGGVGQHPTITLDVPAAQTM